MAERTGLEPATSGVTGQHSNQLNYRSAFNLVCFLSPEGLRKQRPRLLRGVYEVAERTGLEPATSGVTGQHSNQLNYRSTSNAFTGDAWWVLRVSNPRPSPCKGDALPLS